MASPAIYISIYVCLVRHSVNKCPRVLIHWTALILQCVIKLAPQCLSYILLVITFVGYARNTHQPASISRYIPVGHCMYMWPYIIVYHLLL